MRGILFSMVALAACLAVVAAEPASVRSASPSDASLVFGAQCGGISGSNYWCTYNWWTGNMPCGVSIQPATYVTGTGYTSSALPCGLVPKCTAPTAVVGCGGT